MRKSLHARAVAAFRDAFGTAPTSAAYAPGRVEVLGNHTDYNEGLVLSAAIDRGTIVCVGPSTESRCRIIADDLGEEAGFDMGAPSRRDNQAWANYVIGVAAGLPVEDRSTGFHAVIAGDLPLGAGLSSSASLEISAALALCECYGLELDRMALARVAQAAEHDYAGVRCGLLDQISSLYGEEGHLVLTDFRSLQVGTISVPSGLALLVCDTHASHALVDGEYNERRANCEKAARQFAAVCGQPVAALRDVSPDDLTRHAAAIDNLALRRATHIVGENERVARGRDALIGGEVGEFGSLMFASHESSRQNFENSCAELDQLVATARTLPGVYGARLSGGGFGGSIIVLLGEEAVGSVSSSLQNAYHDAFSSDCSALPIRLSAGARIVA